MIMNSIAILLLVFGIIITIAAIIYMLADFIFIGVVKNKKTNY